MTSTVYTTLLTSPHVGTILEMFTLKVVKACRARKFAVADITTMLRHLGCSPKLRLAGLGGVSVSLGGLSPVVRQPFQHPVLCVLPHV